jgi:aspartate/glutamate racemase
VERIHLAQGRDRWQALVNAVKIHSGSGATELVICCSSAHRQMRPSSLHKIQLVVTVTNNSYRV